MLNFGLTFAETEYRDDLVGNSNGVPLDPALRVLPGNNLSNAPEIVATGAITWTPAIGSSGLSALVYVDARVTDDYNTGSDLFPQKAEDSYAVFNARLGIRGAEQRWAVELWAQNLFNTDYAQVAFNSPFQAGAHLARRSSIRNSPAGGRSSPPSSPSRGPTASPAASASDRLRKTERGPRRRRRGPFPCSGSLSRPGGRAAPAKRP